MEPGREKYPRYVRCRGEGQALPVETVRNRGPHNRRLFQCHVHGRRGGRVGNRQLRSRKCLQLLAQSNPDHHRR